MELVGDLSTLPEYDRRYHNEDILGLSWLVENAKVDSHELSTVIQIIADRISLLKVELEATPPFLDSLVRTQVSPQLRVRMNFETDELCVEQWVPFHRAWLVTGYFPKDISGTALVEKLIAGDPRRQSAQAHLAEVREQAIVNRQVNDAKANEKVMAAVDSLSTRALDTFIEVETAMRTGETIYAHGDDANFIESAQEKTRVAAKHGDLEAQRVLTRGGQHDTALCINPGDNPTIRR